MQQPNQPYDKPPIPPMPEGPRHKHHGRVGRFFRGYLMIAGALATAFVLERLLVMLFLEIGKWV